MASVNKAILLGNLGRDPEMRYAPSGDAIANFSIATTETWKDKSGQKQERTEWHRLTAFGKLAEIAGEYLKKGSSVYVEGRIQSDKYTDKEGTEKVSYGVVIDKLQMLGGKSSGQTESPQPAQSQPESNEQKAGSSFDDFESDIPF
jgi:single-strand DNA-binding protein